MWFFLLLTACERPCDTLTCDVDGDGIPQSEDCDDADPAVGVPATWYLDCDGDGVASEESAEACAPPDAPCDGGTWRGENEPRGDCDDADASANTPGDWSYDCDQDGLFGGVLSVCGTPDAGDAQVACGMDEARWSEGVVAAEDCDDADETTTVPTWFPDCDDDGTTAGTGVAGCTPPADTCADGQPPDGSWVETASSPPDCDDEDGSATATVTWAVDCDGDGAFGGLADVCGTPDSADSQDACGHTTAAFDVATTPLDDCDDADGALAAPAAAWLDCDGDNAFSAVSVTTCTPALETCADGEPADGGFVDTPPTTPDCDDEDGSAVTEASWTLDCDADGEIGHVVSVCGTPGAAESADVCGHGLGVFAAGAAEITDCDDTDNGVGVVVWYPDCDGDGVHADTAVADCIQPTSTTVCLDTASPDGGWDPTAPVEADCDDEDPARYPGNTELDGDLVDSNCDGLDDFVPDDSVGSFAAPGGSGSACTMAAPCATIGEAILQASLNSLPTVFAAEGSFTEVMLPLSMDLIGGLDASTWAAGTQETFIDGPGSGPAIRVSGVVSVRDVTVRGSQAAVELLDAADDVTLTDVRLETTTGPALKVTNGTVTGTGVSVQGGGSAVDVGGTVDLDGCDLTHTIRGNANHVVTVFTTGDVTLRACTIEGINGLNVLGAGTAVLEQVDVTGERVGLNAQFGSSGTVTVVDSTVDVCRTAGTVVCTGVKMNGGSVLDGTVIGVGNLVNGNSAGVWLQGVGQSLVSDSVVLHEGGPAINYGIRTDNSTGHDVVIAHTLVSVAGGNANSSAILVGTGVHAAVLNSVVTPPPSAGNYGIYLGSGTFEMHASRFENAAGRDLFRSSPLGTFDLAAFADDCTGVGAGCVSASGNAIEPAGFVDPANGDWHLTAGAACRDVGVDVTVEVPTPWGDADLYGVARDAQPDCGPSEYVP